MVRCKRSSETANSILVVNCHLDWGAEGTRQAREAMELIEERREYSAVLWCGDFNKRPEDPFFSEVRAAGYRDALGFEAGVKTCACGGSPSRLDYVLYTGPVETSSTCPRLPADAPAGLLGGFADLEDLLQRAGSDHTPLAVAFELQLEGKEGRAGTTKEPRDVEPGLRAAAAGV